MTSLDHSTHGNSATQTLHKVTDWYSQHARDLPWRAPGTTAWQVLVSEFMLQQTPVKRVLPVYELWLARWPTARALAQASSGDAVRAWGRLGYPRRALRLHAAATVCVERHGGRVPTTVTELRALPGVGEYTAAAVATFAFRQRHAVLDTNVRRVYARLLDGVEFERPGAPTSSERGRAAELLPTDPDEAAATSVAVMELGAVVCTARSPTCTECPVADVCRWTIEGKPPWPGPVRRGQTYAGTDRQCRGRLLAVLRDAEGSVEEDAFSRVWSDRGQRERAVASLLDDGLIRVAFADKGSGNHYALPR